VDAVVVFSGYGDRDGNLFYLTGARNGFPQGWDDGNVSGLGFSAVIIEVDTRSVYVASPFISLKTFSGHADEIIGDASIVSGVCGVLKRIEARRVALEGLDIMPHRYVEEIRRRLPSVEFIAKDIVSDLRMFKDD